MTATSSIVPCLWFDDQAEQAAQFYTELFPRGRTIAVSRFPASDDNPAGKPPGSVLTVEFEIADQRFTALNGGPHFVINPSISFFVRSDEPAETERLHAALVEGGQELMPLDAYPWSERYAWVEDRFGVTWQLITGRRPEGGATIVPCFMFAGQVHRQAEAAIETYVAAFPDSRVESLRRYAEGEGPVDTIKHGLFVIAGQEMVAMDSHGEHGFTFGQALSMQVMCADQAEVDRYWEVLAEGGEHGPCGWLKDRFGVSWQIVPRALATWLASEDEAARDRTFKAMIGMTRPDIAALEAAFTGT